MYKRKPAHNSTAVLSSNPWRKTTRKVTRSEHNEQCAVVTWLTMKGITFFAVPNGAHKSFSQATKFRREGLKRGVPDIVILTPPPACPGKVGTVLEMKREMSGTKARETAVSEEQHEWIKTFQRNNWKAVIAYGSDEAYKFLEELGY